MVYLLADDGFCLEAGPCQALGEVMMDLERRTQDLGA